MIDRDRIAELEAENAELKVNAEFGMQCYQDRCEGAYIEVSVVRRLEAENKRLRAALDVIKERIDAREALKGMT